jgi:hypothetical protein
MRWLILAAACLAFATRGPAAEREVFYYLGEVKLSSATGQSLGSQVMLFEKIHEPAQSKMIERAVVVQPDGKTQEFTMYLTVKGNHFTLADDKGKVEGSGTLFGPAWKWTYFKAAYRADNGVQIEDENFMADDSAGCARKKITGPDGKVLMYMDMTLKAITPKTFEILKTGLMKQ